MSASHLLHGVGTGCEERVCKIGNHQSDHACALAFQHPRGFIGRVTEPSNGCAHALFGCWAHITASVDHTRDSHDGYAGFACHVGDGGAGVAAPGDLPLRWHERSFLWHALIWRAMRRYQNKSLSPD